VWSTEGTDLLVELRSRTVESETRRLFGLLFGRKILDHVKMVSLSLGTGWRAIQREAQLAAEQLALGATLLGRANHAYPGLYSQAFFALSIGFERTGKLIFVSNYAIVHGGIFPSDRDLRDIGHRLEPLLARCEEIGVALNQHREYAHRPADGIHQAIVQVISSFATRLRYYNLDHLAGADAQQEDPIGMWWRSVVEPILDRHYSKRQRERDEEIGRAMEALIGDSSIVLHSTETGEPIRDVRSYWGRGGATRVAQKYGRFYTLQIVRWLSSLLYELGLEGAYRQRIEPLLGIHEPFTMFYNDDAMLKRRKTWSIYP
jgi:hypothetical protein